MPLVHPDQLDDAQLTDPEFQRGVKLRLWRTQRTLVRLNKWRKRIKGVKKRQEIDDLISQRIDDLELLMATEAKGRSIVGQVFDYV